MRELHPVMTGLRPAAPSLVRYPGIPALPEGTERYRAKGGGSVVVRVESGDGVSVIDSEGGQVCEISFLDEKGRFLAAGLGTTFSNSADGLKAILQEEDESAARTRAALERRGADLAAAGALSIFGTGSSPGNRADFTVAMSPRSARLAS